MGRYVVENLFGIEGWNIAWYGVIIAVGMVLGVALAVFRASRTGLKSDIIYDFIFIAIPVAITCARAYYVIFEWESYVTNPIKVFAIWEGGLAIYGGVLGGLVTAILFCRYHRFPLLCFVDMVIPSLVLGQAIGRWGNFVNQEAFGNLVSNPDLQFFPYAVYIEDLAEWHQATFIYESAWNCCLFILMLYVSSRKVRQGTLFCMYLTGYSLGRFLIEGLRTDSLYLIQGLRVSQALSLVLLVTGVVLWIILSRRKGACAEYAGKYNMAE